MTIAKATQTVDRRQALGILGASAVGLATTTQAGAAATPSTKYRIGLAHPDTGILACGRTVTLEEFAALAEGAFPILVPEESDHFAMQPGPFHVAVVPVPINWHPDDAMAVPPEAYQTQPREWAMRDAIAFNVNQLRGVARRWAIVRISGSNQNGRVLIVSTPAGWRPEKPTEVVPCELTGLSHSAAKQNARRANKVRLKLHAGGKPITEWSVPVRTLEGGAA